jgi:hypothetical protein
MAVATSTTSAQTLSRIDPASVMSFFLLMRVGAVLLYGRKPAEEMIHQNFRDPPLATRYTRRKFRQQRMR